MKINFWYCDSVGMWRWTLSSGTIQESGSSRDLNQSLATLRTMTTKYALDLPNELPEESTYSCSLGITS